MGEFRFEEVLDGKSVIFSSRIVAPGVVGVVSVRESDVDGGFHENDIRDFVPREHVFIERISIVIIVVERAKLFEETSET